MILLDSLQILAAVQGSLKTHILPKLEDDFAQIQVAAALKALEEVSNRIAQGDPCDETNAELLAGARKVAEDHRMSSPDLVARLEAALDAIPSEETGRALNRRLGTALWELVAKNEDPAALDLLELLRAQALKSYSGDTQYISGEAIASLT
jgi:HAMP domain-containing protein